MKARLPKEYQNSGPSNMQGMIKQAQKMQEQMSELQAELENKEYEIKAGGGAVTVKINGKKEITHIDIKPEIVDPDDIETLSDVITAGVNEAIKTVEDDANAEMAKITGGMGGLGGLGGMMPGGLF